MLQCCCPCRWETSLCWSTVSRQHHIHISCTAVTKTSSDLLPPLWCLLTAHTLNHVPVYECHHCLLSCILAISYSISQKLSWDTVFLGRVHFSQKVLELVRGCQHSSVSFEVSSDGISNSAALCVLGCAIQCGCVNISMETVSPFSSLHLTFYLVSFLASQ